MKKLSYLIVIFLFLHGFSVLAVSGADVVEAGDSATAEIDLTGSVGALMEGIIYSESSIGEELLMTAVITESLPLVQAVYNNDNSLMEYEDDYGDNPFMQACYMANMDIVNFFIDKDPSLIHTQNNDDSTCLHYLLSQEPGGDENLNQKIKELIQQRYYIKLQNYVQKRQFAVDVNLKDSNGNNIFMQACKMGNKEMVDYFLDHEDFDFDINEVDISDGNTCLHSLAVFLSAEYVVKKQEGSADLSQLEEEQILYMESMVKRGAQPAKTNNYEQVPFAVYLASLAVGGASSESIMAAEGGGGAFNVSEDGMPQYQLTPEEQQIIAQYYEEELVE